MNKSRYSSFAIPKQTNKQLYFSSSEEEMFQAIDRRPPPEPRHEIEEDSLNQLSGLQIFQIFCDPKQIQAYLTKDKQQKGISIRFLWRVHYIIGQLVIQVQQCLVDQNKLYDCVLLQDTEIDTIAQKIISKAKQNRCDQEILTILSQMLSIYKNNNYNQKSFTTLYKYFVSSSFKELKFQMILNFDNKTNGYSTIDQKAPNGRLPIQLDQDSRKKRSEHNKTASKNFSMSTAQNPRIGSYSVVRMPQEKEYNPLKMAKNNSNSNDPSSGLRGTLSSKQNAESQQSQVMDKGHNTKWSATQEAIFCKIYSEHDSPVVCAQLMQEKIGPDGRWRSPNQIEVKMYSLVEKVFKKFATLSTNNQYIKKFREHKELVLNMSDQVIKKKIFRNIAIIYESMLNVSEQKKAVISHKILQVNRLCKEATYMKK